MNDCRTQDRDQAHPYPPQKCLQVTCPTCKHRVRVYPDNSSKLPPFFPFCSERCKMVDLGAWLNADYRIPSKPDEEEEMEPQTHENSPDDVIDLPE
jgi:uncharacterized protein